MLPSETPTPEITALETPTLDIPTSETLAAEIPIYARTTEQSDYKTSLKIEESSPSQVEDIAISENAFRKTVEEASQQERRFLRHSATSVLVEEKELGIRFVRIRYSSRKRRTFSFQFD